MITISFGGTDIEIRTAASYLQLLICVCVHARREAN